ncbi:MAG: hypothetical protein ACQEWG_09235 [Bacteroidota bacterium]
MKKLYFITPLIILAITTISCEKSKEEILISNYTQTIGKAKMDLNFKMISLEKIKDITAKDSLDILKTEFEKKKNKKLEELRAKLEQNKKDVLQYQAELEDAIKNEPYLVETRKSNLEFRQEMLQQTQKYIRLFETDCKGTFLEPVYNSILRYEETPGKLLATEYNVTYTIENPMLNNAKQEVKSTYLLNDDRTEVLSTY